MSWTVCLEGLPGSGKSTVMTILQGDGDDVVFVQDPSVVVDPPFVHLVRSLLTLRSGQGDSQRVTERSTLSYRHVLAQLMFNDGILSQQQWDVYKDLHGELCRQPPDLVVYFQVPADVCARRTGRPLDQLQRTEFMYDTMLRYENVPIVRVDATQPPELVAAAVRDLITKAREKAGCMHTCTSVAVPVIS